MHIGLEQLKDGYFHFTNYPFKAFYFTPGSYKHYIKCPSTYLHVFDNTLYRVGKILILNISKSTSTLAIY